MTVIAWDGKSLAADKLAILGDTKSTVSKMRTIEKDGKIVAAAYYGVLSDGIAIQDWFFDGADPDDFPITEGAGLVGAYSDGKCLEFEGSPVPIQIQDTYHAWGSGEGFAIGAMAAGKTATEAVEIANYHCASCGRGVDVVEF